MFKNYLVVAWRNIIRQKGFSFINIAGLTLGLTACLLIGLFVWDERRFDKAIPEGDRVYRVYDERTTPEGVSSLTVTPPMFAVTLLQEFPGVEQAMRIMMRQAKPLFEAGEKKIYEDHGIYTESAFFQVLPLPLKYGSYINVLDDPTSIVLSSDMSKRYFGNENPVGKSILVDKATFQVKAVLDELPTHFHLRINYLLPFSTAIEDPERMKSWTWQQFYTYVKLGKGANATALEKNFQTYIKQKVQPQMEEGNMTYMPFLQPLHDIHLQSSSFKYDNAIRGNITYVNGLTIIAVFILLIACFNFVNLATAKSLKRAREVGVRKSIGASRKQLILQFTGETILLTTISLFLATALTIILMPALNNFTGKAISLSIFGNPLFLLLLLVLALFVGIIAGTYPALVLSSFQPVKVLKAATVIDPGAGKIQWLRHGLVVVQFSLSVLLIVSAIVVFRQVKYLHNKDLGFNKEQIMFFPMRGDNMFNNYEAFKNELSNSSAVSAASIGYGFPGDIFAGDDIIVPREGQKESHPATHLMVDYDYAKTLNLQFVAGRYFSPAIQSDKDNAFVINETAVKELGFQTPEKAIGQTLWWHPWETIQPDSMKVGKIIGVVKDFNYKSLYDKMEVAVLQIYPPAYWKVAVKIKTASLASGISHVKGAWNKFSPEFPIEYNFMDDNFAAFYVSEDKLGSLLGIFTGIAIFIGCLGLFGLAAYAAERRKKEIGIRKTLGASVQNIVMLLSSDFIKLVFVALLIASPVAWYFMRNWLQDFAYRTSMPWWIFFVAGALAIVIAIITTSFQAIKAAVANPVKSLRTE
ncbi:MAG TPA: ABC transporter permease [Chitinophagaceae bacterium]